ncbi:Uncharacterised protein [Mycobacteroides abscessus subsp. abscessus]|nr:Uncharacterised protein [Mycobacteroides abscessus subsp. abscessus]
MIWAAFLASGGPPPSGSPSQSLASCPLAGTEDAR